MTGVLCHCATSKIFMQVLEGGRGAVSALYNRIAQDPRHRDIVLLSYEEIGERSFSGWSMGQVSMNRLNPALLLKYSESAVLDPYSVSGKASLALFNELVATASVASSGLAGRRRIARRSTRRRRGRLRACGGRRGRGASSRRPGFFWTVVVTGPIGLA